MTAGKLITAPPLNPILGHAQAFTTDLLKLQEDLAAQGDFVKVRSLWMTLYYLNHPDLIRELLVKRAKVTRKQFTIKRISETYTEANLFSSDGDFWKQQRKLMQPAFHSQRIGAYADEMVAQTEQALADWQDGATIDIDRFMADLTMRIIVKTMFGKDVDASFADIDKTVTQIMENAAEDAMDASTMLPNWVPTKRVRRSRALNERLTPIYQSFMDEWRQEGVDRGDLLSMLMMARYDDGSVMSDAQIMSELSIIFLAGHETTAKTLTFAAMMLSEHPEIAAKLRDEVDRVLGSRAATLQDLGQLTYTTQIIKETMRLFPAAIAVGREAETDFELGGETIRKGAHLVANIWSVQRDARWYADPDRFNPDRWTPTFEAELPRYAYIPFGAGPRVCLGNQFAMMEAQIALATIAQRYSLTLTPGTTLAPNFRFTLHPGPETVPMRIKQRQPAAV